MKFKTPYLAIGGSVLLAAGLLTTASRLPQEGALQAVGAVNVFSRVDQKDDFSLTYGWQDFGGKDRSLAFSITRKDLSDAESELGYTMEELGLHLETWAFDRNRGMIIYLKGIIRGLIEESGYADYILIEETNALSFSLKLSVPFNLQDKVKPVYESIKAKLAEEYGSSAKKIESEMAEERKRFIEARGFVTEGDRIRVDYRKSVLRNRLRVRHVLEAMRRIDEKLNLRQFLGVSLSFIQDLAYGVPPDFEGERLILGFWVPPKVLVNNFGDCDSKGVTFASLWTNFKNYPVILIRVPDHMFVGLAIPSMGSEGVVINGLRYTLCEVSATGKMPPGFISYSSSAFLESGRYQYEIVSR